MSLVSVKIVLWLQLTHWGIESDGTVNHLLETSNPRTTEYAISISTEKPLPIKPKQWFKAEITGECSLGLILHNDVPARAYLCNANTIRIDDEVFTDINHTTPK